MRRKRISYWLIAQLLFFQNGICPVCKKSLKGTIMHIHHIDINPANNVIENLLAVHADCHYMFHRNEPLEDDVELGPEIIETGLPELCPRCTQIELILTNFIKFEVLKDSNLRTTKELLEQSTSRFHSLMDIVNLFPKSIRISSARKEMEQAFFAFYGMYDVKYEQDIADGTEELVTRLNEGWEHYKDGANGTFIVRRRVPRK